MKKVIITGANGFIGGWLVKEFVKNNFFVYAIIKDKNEDISIISDLDNIKIVYCDLSEIAALSDLIVEDTIEAFYHLAWVGSGGPLRADYNVQLNNVRYSCDAATAAKKLNCKKFLCAGTITENIVDNTLKQGQVSQNMIYGIAKKTTHLLLNVHCKMIGLPFVWMQFSNIYGPYNMSGNLISYTFNEICLGRIPEFSKGLQPYDFIYVKDLVKAAYLLAVSTLTESSYFLGSGTSRKLHEYLEEIPKIISGSEVAIGKRPEDGVIYLEEWFSIETLERDTGFIPEYTFQEGIEETFKWYRDNIKE